MCILFIQEAAIYLLEGVENEKLVHHPTGTISYWAYIVIHHPACYTAELVVSVLLMLLAFVESPKFFNVPNRVSLLFVTRSAKINHVRA